MLYGVILWRLGWTPIRDTVASIHVWPLLGALGIEAASLWLRVYKWRLALGPGQSAARLCFLSKAGGNLSPGRVGEFAPLAMREHRTAKLGAWILLDRLLEVAMTLALGILGFVALGVDENGRAIIWIAGGLAVLLAAGVLSTRHRAIEKVAQRLPREGALHKLATTLASVSRELRELGSRAPAQVAVTLVVKAMDLAGSILLFAAFGAWPSFAALAVAQCIHGLTSIVPITPNATGIPYLTAAAFLHTAVGIPIEILALAVPARMLIANAVFWPSFAVGVTRRR